MKFLEFIKAAWSVLMGLLLLLIILAPLLLYFFADPDSDKHPELYQVLGYYGIFVVMVIINRILEKRGD